MKLQPKDKVKVKTKEEILELYNSETYPEYLQRLTDEEMNDFCNKTFIVHSLVGKVIWVYSVEHGISLQPFHDYEVESIKE